MFVYNFKINDNFIFKIILTFIILISVIILIISSLNLFKNTKYEITANTLNTNKRLIVDNNNYTNILKEVYNNINSYIGYEINFSGYVYRTQNMKSNEFVLARDMLINSDNQSVVVGFLCTSDNAKNYQNGTWVNISGNIIKGYYHDQIPVIEVSKIKKTKAPENAFVYPPDMSNI